MRLTRSSVPMLVVAVGLWVGCAAHSHSPAVSTSSELAGHQVADHWEKPSRPVGLPGWAFELPASFRDVVAVGCSPLAPPDRSLELAIERAYNNWARAQSVRIEARQAEFFEGRFLFSEQHAHEILDKEAAERCRSQAAVLDTFVVRGPPGVRTVRTYVLVGPSGTILPPESQTFQKFDSSGPPKWFEELPEVPGYLFGVGSCGFYKRPSEAWDAVEKLARLDLAGQIFSKEHSDFVDELREKGTLTTGFREHQVQTDLRSAVIVARHYDPEARVFYALARMPIR